MSESLRREFDLLVLGAGIAGLTAALAAAEEGRSVAVISKEPVLAECNTRYAQGGIVASGEEDSPAPRFRHHGGRRWHQLPRGRGAARRRGPRRWSTGCSWTPSGSPSTGDAGEGSRGHRRQRTRCVASTIRRTRRDNAIETELLRAVEKHPRITCFPSHLAIDLITNTHNSTDNQERYRKTRVIGAYLWDPATAAVAILRFRGHLLATGGVGNLFLHTSNPPGATGDGLAMANRVGAEILNTEYVQFHPTVLFHRDIKRFLISEALRGEGARLLNHAG